MVIESGLVFIYVVLVPLKYHHVREFNSETIPSFVALKVGNAICRRLIQTTNICMYCGYIKDKMDIVRT